MNLASVLSVLILGMLTLTGGSPELYSVHVTYDGRSSLGITPIWLVWLPHDHWWLLGGLAQGNAIFNIAAISTDTYAPPWFVVAHEIQHTRQWLALGWWMVPLYMLDVATGNKLMNFEGYIFEHDIGAATVAPDAAFCGRSLRRMWAPPVWWPNQWAFLTLSLCHGETTRDPGGGKNEGLTQ